MEIKIVVEQNGEKLVELRECAIVDMIKEEYDIDVTRLLHRLYKLLKNKLRVS